MRRTSWTLPAGGFQQLTDTLGCANGSAYADALVQYKVAGSPLANHVAQVGEAVRQALVPEVSAAMPAYMDDAGLAFPIEGHIVIAQK
jgi:hypothetical protein